MKFKTIEELYTALVAAYYEKRDVEATLACVTDNIKWIGTENDDSAFNKDQLRELLLKDVASFPDSFQIEMQEPVIEYLSDTIADVYVLGHQIEVPGVVCSFTLRGTFNCIKKQGGWLIASLHASVPNSEMEKFTLEQKLAEKRRLESTIMASMPGGVAIYRLKKSGRVATEYVSESLATMCGYTAEEFLEYLRYDSIVNLVPEDIPHVMAVVKDNIAKDEDISVNYRIYTKKRDTVLIHLDAKRIATDQLQEDDIAVLYAVHTIVGDESKRLIEEQRRLRQLINAVPVGIGVYEVINGKPSQVYLNDSFYAMLGENRKDREAYMGANTMEAAYPEDLPIIADGVKRLVEGADTVEIIYRLSLKNNDLFWVHNTISVVERRGDYLRAYAVLADYNQIKHAQQAVDNAQLTLKTALQSAKVLTWRYDYKHNRITDTLTLGEAIGLSKVVENVPQAFLEANFIAPESRAAYLKLFEEIAQEKLASADIRSRGTGNRGYKWFRQIYTPVYDNKGKYVDAIGIAIDITEQKTREQHYEEQLHLNKTATKNALATASYNLTTNTVTEYLSQEPKLIEIVELTNADEQLRAICDSNSDLQAKEQFKLLYGTKALIQSYKKGISHIEIRHQLKNDSRWVLTAFDIITNPYNGDIEAVGRLNDITSSVQAELVVKQLLQVDYQSIYIFDLLNKKAIPFKKNTHLDISETVDLEELNGVPYTGFDQYLGMHAPEHLKEKYIRENSLPYIMERLEQAPYYECMYTLVIDGKNRQYRILYSYLDKNKRLLLSALQDTTDLYEQEEMQKQKLAGALKEAERANRAKTEFMNRMSHDMRTPMNAIIGLSALTLDDAKNPELVRSNMGKMRQASDFMLGLVNDVLDMAKIEDGAITLNMEPYSYADFVSNMKTMFIPQCEAKGISISFVESTLGLIGITDRIRINQIFFNIYSNAVKYTPTGGSITTSLANMTKEGDIVSGDYIIEDTGIGMSEEFQKQLFSPFMQEDSSVTPELQGTGLGLSITKQLVELMGGTIRIESTKGKGTRVIVHLGFQMATAEAQQSQPKRVSQQEFSHLSGCRVLLVEDHPLNAQIARRLLEKQNMQVTYAEDGRVAVDKFKASTPGSFDVVLMDVRMPEMSGFEATKTIRGLDRADAKTIPIIAMSANAYQEDKRKGFDSGMNDYLTKPVEPRLLYEALLRAIAGTEGK